MNLHKLAFVSLFFCSLWNSLLAQDQEAQRPNVIYIYADDLGYGELGSYGQEKIKTPHLDKIAEEGMRFTQHYSSSPVCAPARCMLLTGKHAGHAYIRSNSELGGFTDDEEKGQMPLYENAFTLGHLFKNAGYTTAAIGKWGLGMANTTGSPLKQGFDYFYGYLDQKQAHNYYPTHLWENDKWDTLRNPVIDVHKKLDATTATDSDFAYYKGEDYSITKMMEKAIGFVRENKNNPFFLYLPFTIPHASLQAPDEYIKQYVGMFGEKPYYGEQRYAPTKYPLSTYAAMITYMDAQVGVILEEIKKLGIDDNTIILFSSDNGATFNGGVNASFFNSVSGLNGLKMDVYEGGIRVPFIARWPGKIEANAVSDLPSVQYDMMATFAELTNQTAPDNTDGISILPTLLGDNTNQQKHDFLYFEFPGKGGQMAVRIGDWKAVKLNVARKPDTPWKLFNLKTDRNETEDVASENQKIIERINKIVLKQHQPAHIKEWDFIDAKYFKGGNHE
ncbi:arylsulfatase [Sphingobacterium sp. SGG-5]|uniref:arylsulfatase n=1 Tax=Sphingobacterium sp. SGG-5 TaxID=2710881 RepID=UPI0013EC8AEB|nr:arylsulfatase [Sphingobacterium sp. SGG-5]NGM60531.1 arylsulfatase [Sphingobacterium sp. SGG-5]